MPLYVRAGAIIPTDPIRQYTAEKVSQPSMIAIYPGADGSFTLNNINFNAQHHADAVFVRKSVVGLK